MELRIKISPEMAKRILERLPGGEMLFRELARAFLAEPERTEA